MNIQNRHKLLPTIILLLVQSITFAQGNTSLFDSAKTCYSKQQFVQCCSLLKRLNYFEPSYKTDSVQLLMARSLYHQQFYSQAYNHYTVLPDSLYLLEKAMCLCLDNRFPDAAIMLNRCSPDSANASVYYFIKASIALKNEQTQDALNYFLLMATENKALSLAITQNFARLNKIQSRNILPYQIASAIVPGLGLMLNGQFVDGLLAFGLVAAMGSVFVFTTINYSLFDAAIAISPWLLRYYIGQIKRIDTLQKQEIANIKAHCYADVLQYISSQHSACKLNVSKP